jgi:ATP-dependent RNA helicase RhlB
LVIAPTRELVVQIERDARLLGQDTGLTIQVVFGGMDYQKQREELARGTDLLIGTPGRLIDYYKQKVFHLKGVEIAVIDEADRMFDMGFIADIRYLLRKMPPFQQRQSMLFSATLSFRVMELSYEHMNNPVKVEIAPELVAPREIRQLLFHISKEEKFPLLLGLLKRDQGTRVLIFINTKREGEFLLERLTRNGFQAKYLSGDVPQKTRLRVLGDFSEGRVPILISTDVASRGLHIEAVSHVINYDVPQDPEDYVHRIGRTARAGATGDAITLACEQYVSHLPAIEEYLGQKIPVEWVTDDLLVRDKQPASRSRRRRPRN